MTDPSKQQVLQWVTNLVKKGQLSKDELLSAYNAGDVTTADTVTAKRLGVAEILYYLGGTVIFLGIVILLSQNWDALNLAARLTSTMGAAILAYVLGAVLGKDTKTESVGSAFYLISALVMPIGLMVMLDAAGWNVAEAASHIVMAACLTTIYLASYFALRKNILLLFGAVFGAWLFFAVTQQLVLDNAYFATSDFDNYRILLMGVTFALLGYAFNGTVRAPLKGFFYAFGALGFLYAAFMLGGFKPNQNYIWEAIFPALVFGVLFLSVYLKSRAFLVWGTIFLMVFIVKITFAYFSSGLGWPLALVLSGLAMMGIGYMSFMLQQKYFAKKNLNVQ